MNDRLFHHSDHELLLFINAQSVSQTIDELEARCVKKFGCYRAPNHNVLEQYLQSLKTPNNLSLKES